MSSIAVSQPLYVPFQGWVSTMYAELAERVRTEPFLLPGTPGTLTLRERPGFGLYWYRRYYASPGTPQAEDFVCSHGDVGAYDAMRLRVQAGAWAQQQVRDLRRLGLQVADKDVARVLVELHNRALFGAGLVLVGTLAFMAWLNEFGVRANTSRTQDVALARRQTLGLAAPISFFDVMSATDLGFSAIPGLRPTEPPTSIKRPGKEGLRVDLLTSGRELGKAISIRELQWHAQAMPHFDYLLTSPRDASVLAGGHCTPVRVPAPERFAWHKLYSSTHRRLDTAKAAKDLQQAATLLALLVERDDLGLVATAKELPGALLTAARRRLPSLRSLLAPHAQTLDEVEQALASH